jgi:hypothetical protein
MEPTVEDLIANLNRSLTNVTPSTETIELIEAVREEAKALGEVILRLVPGSRERSLAITHLEETTMWAVKGLVLNG